MGRMLTFMARIWKEKSIPAGGFVRGVGVDEKTALILNTTSGEVRATGSSSAYVCTAASRPEVCIPGTPLTFKNIDCVRLDAAQHHVYSFASFTGEGTKYQNNIIDGKINEEPYGPQ
jgi:cyanophycinase-like exopeptidase